MPHPFSQDHLGQAWIELSGANPLLVEQYRPSLIAFLAFDRGLSAKLVGTGFVMCGNADMAFVITARHVLEGIAQIQQPGSIPALSTNPRLSPQDVKALWMGSASAGLLNIPHVSFNPRTDVAVCTIASQEIDPPPFAPVSVPLHPIVPRVGEIVQMVSIDNMEVFELKPPKDRSSKGQVLSLFRRVSIRIGTVTGTYPDGLRQYHWPCFTTSIPAEPGMSGGFVFLPREGTTVAACGVVSADSFSGAARNDQMQSGNSIVACSWPAFGLLVPQTIGGTDGSSFRSLLDMVRSGNVPEPLGGVSHLRMVSTADGTTCLEMWIPSSGSNDV
jgi:hypothetical protein